MEVDSDKATLEVPSPISGKVIEVLVGEGDEVPVGSVIARIELGEAPAKAAQSASSVSVETGYVTDETKEQILQKADAHAKSVASKAKDYTPA